MLNRLSDFRQPVATALRSHAVSREAVVPVEGAGAWANLRLFMMTFIAGFVAISALIA